MQAIRDALFEVADMDGITPDVHWTLEDIAYQEIGDPFSIWWS